MALVTKYTLANGQGFAVEDPDHDSPCGCRTCPIHQEEEELESELTEEEWVSAILDDVTSRSAVEMMALANGLATHLNWSITLPLSRGYN